MTAVARLQLEHQFSLLKLEHAKRIADINQHFRTLRYEARNELADKIAKISKVYHDVININKQQRQSLWKETISFPAQAGTLQSTIDWKRVINFFCNGVAHSKNNPYLCNVVQLMQASVSPTTAVGIFYVKTENNNSSVPCGALMRPLPALGVRQWGAELFSSPEINKYIVSFQSRTK